MLSCWHFPLPSPTSCPYSESLVGMCASIRDTHVMLCTLLLHWVLYAADCKNYQDLLLPFFPCFKINGDIVHFPRSGKVLQLPKFYVMLENGVNWKLSMVLKTLLVWDGTGIILHFKHLYWSAIECRVKSVLWPQQASCKYSFFVPMLFVFISIACICHWKSGQ